MGSNIDEFDRALNDFTLRVVPTDVKRLQTAVCFEVISRVVLRTPVELGRARANWILQLGSDPTGLIDADDRSGSRAIAAAQRVALAAPAFSLLVFGNNLPYIETIETGGYRPPDPENTPEANKRRAASRSPATRRRAQAVAGNAGAPLVKGGFSLQAPRGMVAISVEEVVQLFSGAAA